jgi:DNA-binding NarL/FixJ family response regulator
MTPVNKIKILIVEDHQLVREGLQALISTHAQFEIIGTAINGKEAIQKIKTGITPDIILLDHDMPVMSGLEALTIIKKDFFGIKVIMLTMMNTKDLVEQAIQAGVDGFLFKNSSLDELSLAINQVYHGQKYFTGEVALILMNKKANPDDALLSRLSDRELEILRLVAKGKSSVEIGALLFISPRTVDTHRNNIIQKLEVHGIAGLTEFAIKKKLI